MGLNDHERDVILWNQFKNGDEAAFANLFRSYYSPLFNYGCKITGNHNLVEDCIQELFLDLWRTAGKAEILSPKAYIFKAFKFKLVKLIAQNNKIGSITGDATENNFEISHELFLENKDQQLAITKKIFDAFEKLSPRQKEIIYLKFYHNLSYEAVSEIMDINYQAARNLLSQSIKALKNTVTLFILLQLFSF